LLFFRQQSFDKQNTYQPPTNQFMSGNNGLNYGSNPSYLMQQQMHDQAGPQSGGAGGPAGPRSMKNQAGGGGASSQKYNNNQLWQ